MVWLIQNNDLLNLKTNKAGFVKSSSLLLKQQKCLNYGEEDESKIKNRGKEVENNFLGISRRPGSEERKHSPKLLKEQQDQLPRRRASNIQISAKPDLIFINHQKTLKYNSRNMAIEEFARSMLLPDPRSHQSPLCRLNNFFNLLHRTWRSFKQLSSHSHTLPLSSSQY